MAPRFLKRWKAKHDESIQETYPDQNVTGAAIEKGGPLAVKPEGDLQAPVAEIGDEDVISGNTTPSGTDDWPEDHPALKDIPPSVRRVVSLDDDPTLPTLTFRYFILTFVFVIPGAFLSQMSHYRTTYAPYSVFFVQITSGSLSLQLCANCKKGNGPFITYVVVDSYLKEACSNCHDGGNGAKGSFRQDIVNVEAELRAALEPAPEIAGMAQQTITRGGRCTKMASKASQAPLVPKFSFPINPMRQPREWLWAAENAKESHQQLSLEPPAGP